MCTARYAGGTHFGVLYLIGQSYLAISYIAIDDESLAESRSISTTGDCLYLMSKVLTKNNKTQKYCGGRSPPQYFWVLDGSLLILKLLLKNSWSVDSKRLCT
jgi:hypothetical protein